MGAAPLHIAVVLRVKRQLEQWASRLTVVLCSVIVSIALSPAAVSAAGWTAADLPQGVDASSVAIGYLITKEKYEEAVASTSINPLLDASLVSPITITIADLDSNGDYIVADGAILIPAMPGLEASVGYIRAFFSSDPSQLPALESKLQAVALFGNGIAKYSTDGLAATGFATVSAIALESEDVSSNLVVKLLFETLPKYMLGTSEQLTSLVDSAVAYGTALGLQPDDPGLLAILAAIQAGTFDLTPDPIEDTAAIYDAIGVHQQARLRGLVNAQPDLVGVVIAGEAATSDVTQSPVTGYAPFTFEQSEIKLSRRGPVWFDLSASYDLSGATEPYLFGVAGAHVSLGKGVVLGGMVEFDRADSGAVTGSGWLAGPYLVARLPDLLDLDARLLYGRVSDEGEMLGIGDESLDSDRLLAALALSRPVSLGEITLTPRLAATYAAERSAAYTTDLGSDIAGVETGILQIDAGFAAAFALGEVAVTTGLAANWIETVVGDATDDGLAAEASLGLDWALSDAASIAVDFGLAGIGGATQTGTIKAGLTGSY